jgi:hypothetical protein
LKFERSFESIVCAPLTNFGISPLICSAYTIDEACLRFQHLASASPAIKSDLGSLRHWLDHKKGGNLFLKDAGAERHPWRKEELEVDLTSLTSRDKDKDALSKWIDARVVPFYYDKIGYPDPMSLAESGTLLQPLHYYSESYVSTTINALSTTLSCLLPTISIFVLYFIHSPLWRLGAIVGFTFLFSVVLTLIAKVRRIDCFAATTAFAAILVVFVSVGPV